MHPRLSEALQESHRHVSKFLSHRHHLSEKHARKASLLAGGDRHEEADDATAVEDENTSKPQRQHHAARVGSRRLHGQNQPPVAAGASMELPSALSTSMLAFLPD